MINISAIRTAASTASSKALGLFSKTAPAAFDATTSMAADTVTIVADQAVVNEAATEAATTVAEVIARKTFVKTAIAAVQAHPAIAAGAAVAVVVGGVVTYKVVSKRREAKAAQEVIDKLKAATVEKTTAEAV